jgi:hypothetical protein
MPLNKVLLITRFIRTFDHTELDVSDESNLPKVFQAAEPWYNHIQEVSSQLFLPGTNITIDECIQVILNIYVRHTTMPLWRLLCEPLSVSTELATTWPEVDMLDENGKTVERGVKKNADGYVTLQGSTVAGVKYIYSLRGWGPVLRADLNHYMTSTYTFQMI